MTIVGILKEIKENEKRVSMTPGGVFAMKKAGHTVLVEKAAGEGSGFSDAEYVAQGAEIVDTAAEVYKRAEMVMHVKEPMASEYAMIEERHTVFTYLHLAADKPLTEALVKSKAKAIAYETVQPEDRSLPLLTPMSEIAGRMSIQQGAKCLESPQGGKGVLLGGVPGVAPGKVMIIGGGAVGTHAARMACGLGATVYILDISLPRLRYLDEILPANCITMMSSPANIHGLLPEVDLVIGAVLIPGAKAPHMLTREDLKLMKPGSVIVDVAIDQGGCLETSRVTTHASPTYVEEGIIHYCVGNIPGAVSKTATMALTNATLPYALQIAGKGWKKAAEDSIAIRRGCNVIDGKITFKGVADAFGFDYTDIDTLL